MPEDRYSSLAMNNNTPLLIPIDSTESPPNRVAPPGETIRVKLEERGWGQADLAKILDRPLPTVNEIIQGKRAIMPEMAIALGHAFGNGAMEWMTLESQYRISLLVQTDTDTKKRAKLFSLAPVKDMQRRGWITSVDSLDVLEAEICRFFEKKSVDDPDQNILAAARKSDQTGDFTTAQNAWLTRASQLAKLATARPFVRARLEAQLPEIKALASSPEKARSVPLALAELGVRLVIVEALPKTRIDGAAFWIDEHSPVIAMTVRYDRIDYFWFTLAHELAHILHGDHQSIDSNLVGEHRETSSVQMEVLADEFAANFLVSSKDLKSFILRVHPFYSKDHITQFAKRMKVHPGIVTGQLQNQRKIGFKVNREMLVKIREFILSTSFSDGWGVCPGATNYE